MGERKMGNTRVGRCMDGGWKKWDAEGGKVAKLGKQRSGSIPERFWSAGAASVLGTLMEGNY